MPKRSPGRRPLLMIQVSSYKRNPEYLRECINILKQFANISGLQCNLEKPSVIPIGGNFDTSDKLCPELGLKLESEFTLLGFQMTLMSIIKNASNVYMLLVGNGLGINFP